MGVSVCLASGKAGVGTSTITANLGIALSRMGIPSLIVDGDLEGASLGLILGVDPNTPSIHDCLSGKIKCEEAVIETFGTKAVVGGIKIEQLVGASLDTFQKVIEDFTDKFDVVLVDSPGGLRSDTVTVIRSCQSVILILTPDINSVTNALKTLAVAKKVGAAILGGIINRGGGRYDIPSDKISELLRVEIIAEIKEDEAVKKSLLDAVPVVVEYPDSEFSLQIKRIASKLVGG